MNVAKRFTQIAKIRSCVSSRTRMTSSCANKLSNRVNSAHRMFLVYHRRQDLQILCFYINGAMVLTSNPMSFSWGGRLSSVS